MAKMTDEEPRWAIERIEGALAIIERYGGIDGEHHKTWVLDQAVRSLLGTPEAYAEWVRQMNAGKDGANTYEWDIGIPP
jgi:hypothetical protein